MSYLNFRVGFSICHYWDSIVRNIGFCSEITPQEDFDCGHCLYCGFHLWTPFDNSGMYLPTFCHDNIIYITIYNTLARLRRANSSNFKIYYILGWRILAGSLRLLCRRLAISLYRPVWIHHNCLRIWSAKLPWWFVSHDEAKSWNVGESTPCFPLHDPFSTHHICKFTN